MTIIHKHIDDISSMMEVKLILPGLLMNLKFMDHLLLLG